VRWVSLVVCCACGRVNFDRGTDASGDVLGEFSTALPIAELDSGLGEDDPSLTGDLLEIYFQSNRSGSERLYYATRGSRTSAWSAVLPVDAVNAGGNSNNAKITPDGLTLVFASQRAPNAGGSDLWITTRADRSAAWSAPRRIDELATTTSDFEPWLAANDLYYVATPVPADPQLVVAQRALPSDPFGPPTELTVLCSGSYDGGPWVSRSGLVFMFHSLRDSARAATEMYVATRPTTMDEWGAPELSPFNAPADDTDPWLSPDGTTFVFSSNRDGGMYKLYMATR